MPLKDRKTIRFRGRTEPVIESFHLSGRTYLALEKLSAHGAYRVFDSHAGPHGDYRALHRIGQPQVTRQQLDVLRQLGGPNANRNFPGCVDYVRQRGDLFLVIAWVHGTNLRHYLSAVRNRKTPRPSVSEVVRLVRGLVHGVSHYHRKTNIVHGDISPANIVISAGTKNLVLIDFGAAWPIQRAAQREHDAYTQPYAAPERIAKHASEDFRSDMFSLSAIAYEMLTLVLPYEGLGGQAGRPTLAAKTAGSYRDPSSLITSPGRLTKETLGLLDQCVGAGLKLHPDERFATSQQWLAAWDSLHFSLRKGDRLSRIERLFLTGIDSLVSRFSRKHP
jgi:serine/threonine protein kinase